MKIDPISTHERCLIISQLALTGNWEATRMGADIRLVRYRAGGRSLVQYSVRRGPLTVTAQVRTVFDAVAEVNQLVRGQKRAPELVYSRHMQPKETWLPYKDA